MNCTTHHCACDCREEKMKLICKEVIWLHREGCTCKVCEAIRELYGDNFVEKITREVWL